MSPYWSRAGSRVRYANPFEDETEYVSVCMPAFSPDAVHRGVGRNRGMRGTGGPHGGFNYRVAGIALSEGRLLLHTSDRDDFWSLPGGRCEFGETSAEALVREMREELG